MLVEGSAEFGGARGRALAVDVARRWVAGNAALLAATGFMHEKYDARSAGGEVGRGGEYAPQRGFGWSNGVALVFVRKYCCDSDDVHELDALNSSIQTLTLRAQQRRNAL